MNKNLLKQKAWSLSTSMWVQWLYIRVATILVFLNRESCNVPWPFQILSFAYAWIACVAGARGLARVFKGILGGEWEDERRGSACSATLAFHIMPPNDIMSALCDVFVWFSVWFFKMELKPLLNLLNTRLSIINNGLFCGNEHRKQKITGLIISAFIDKITMLN